ncbi:MAG: hypothetical protein H7Z17_08710 [Fuerstia sp.]|nr:hypothetical protein [Fuerstiella sp.]
MTEFTSHGKDCRKPAAAGQSQNLKGQPAITNSERPINSCGEMRVTNEPVPPAILGVRGLSRRASATMGLGPIER